MNNYILLLLISLVLSGCFTVTKSIDASKFELGVKKEPMGNIIVGFSNSDANAVFLFDNIDCQVMLKKNRFSIYSKDQVSAELNVKNLNLEKREKSDSLFLKPKADELSLVFSPPLKTQKGKLQFFVKEARLDKKENKLKITASIRLYSILSFKNPSKEAFPNPQNIKGNIKTTFSELPQKLDRQFSGKDLANGCNDDLFWNGGSRINTASGNTIGITSNVRYENWTCGTFKTRKFQKTTDVDYNVMLGSRDGSIFCSVDATNLRGVPGFFEDVIENWFSIELGRTFTFSPKGYKVDISNILINKLSQSSVNINTGFVLQKK